MDFNQRKIIAYALRRALPYLSLTRYDTYSTGPTRRCEFLCHCVDAARDRNEISSSVAEITRDYISRQIEGMGTLYSWIRNKHPELKKQLEDDYKRNSIKMQRTRAAWAWHMICELEA